MGTDRDPDASPTTNRPREWCARGRSCGETRRPASGRDPAQRPEVRGEREGAGVEPRGADQGSVDLEEVVDRPADRERAARIDDDVALNVGADGNRVREGGGRYVPDVRDVGAEDV